MESILDGIIRTPPNLLGNHAPDIAIPFLPNQDGAILFLCPRLLVYIRGQVIMPALTALLTTSTLKLCTHSRPLPDSLSLDDLD